MASKLSLFPFLFFLKGLVFFEKEMETPLKNGSTPTTTTTLNEKKAEDSQTLPQQQHGGNLPPSEMDANMYVHKMIGEEGNRMPSQYTPIYPRSQEQFVPSFRHLPYDRVRNGLYYSSQSPSLSRYPPQSMHPSPYFPRYPDPRKTAPQQYQYERPSSERPRLPFQGSKEQISPQQKTENQKENEHIPSAPNSSTNSSPSTSAPSPSSSPSSVPPSPVTLSSSPSSNSSSPSSSPSFSPSSSSLSSSSAPASPAVSSSSPASQPASLSSSSPASSSALAQKESSPGKPSPRFPIQPFNPSEASNSSSPSSPPQDSLPNANHSPSTNGFSLDPQTPSLIPAHILMTPKTISQREERSSPFMTQARHQSNGGSPYSVVSPQSMQKSVSRVHLCLGPSPSALSHDLLQMVNNKACADLKFVVENKPFYAHKMIFAVRSPKLFAQISQANSEEVLKESKSGMAVCSVPGISYDAFYIVVRFIYTDYVEVTLDLAMEVLATASILEVEKLVTLIEEELIQKHLCVENAAWMLQGADAAQVLSLRNACMSLILREFDSVCKTDSLRLLSRDLILEILKRR